MADRQADLIFTSAGSSKRAVPIVALYDDETIEDAGLDGAAFVAAKVSGFSGKAGAVALLPDDKGSLLKVLFGLGRRDEQQAYHQFGSLASQLPAGVYELGAPFDTSFEAALYWGLGAYRFNRYKNKGSKTEASLKLSKKIDEDKLRNTVSAVYLGRDLINTPANDLGPAAFESEVRGLAKRFKARVKVIKGEALLDQNFPMIHAVGRAAAEAPRLVELSWGKASDPAVTLVGKGICFDTGGLNLKPGNAMSLMKKDMGGAATALTIAAMIMGAGLALSLRVLLPIAENNISGNAFRPGDVLQSRKGLTVEIENTDAEGRLVLADALSLADERPLEHLFCFATLTGAARVGLGPDLPPFYTDDEALASGLETAAFETRDFLWRLPFWGPYDKLLNSKIADVNHISSGPFAGSITAALFLRRFVENAPRFAHFDIYGWSPETLPGRPYGGEPQAARAVFSYLEAHYGSPKRQKGQG